MSELRRRDVKILIEAMAWGGTWQGVEMGAFIADPLGQHLRTLKNLHRILKDRVTGR
jgi:hypothetical protein